MIYIGASSLYNNVSVEIQVIHEPMHGLKVTRKWNHSLQHQLQPILSAWLILRGVISMISWSTCVFHYCNKGFHTRLSKKKKKETQFECLTKRFSVWSVVCLCDNKNMNRVNHIVTPSVVWWNWVVQFRLTSSGRLVRQDSKLCHFILKEIKQTQNHWS